MIHLNKNQIKMNAFKSCNVFAHPTTVKIDLMLDLRHYQKLPLTQVQEHTLRNYYFNLMIPLFFERLILRDEFSLTDLSPDV